jgi:hypothetical protein
VKKVALACGIIALIVGIGYAVNSKRVEQQILRNNIARNLHEYDLDSQLQLSVEEYFEMWGDAGFPRGPDGAHVFFVDNVFSEEEAESLQSLAHLLNKAYGQARNMTVAQFRQSEWPVAIDESVRRSLIVIKARGKFSESWSEVQPSQKFEF